MLVVASLIGNRLRVCAHILKARNQRRVIGWELSRQFKLPLGVGCSIVESVVVFGRWLCYCGLADYGLSRIWKAVNYPVILALAGVRERYNLRTWHLQRQVLARLCVYEFLRGSIFPRKSAKLNPLY